MKTHPETTNNKAILIELCRVQGGTRGGVRKTIARSSDCQTQRVVAVVAASEVG